MGSSSSQGGRAAAQRGGGSVRGKGEALPAARRGKRGAGAAAAVHSSPAARLPPEPPAPLPAPPPSPTATGCSRKTLVYLILTLNHIYPDYDFSLLRA